MGCGRSFYVLGDGKELYISEGDESMGCVCTGYGLLCGDLAAEEVYDYAMLGAALRMTKEGASGSVQRIVPEKFARQLRALLGIADAP